MRSSAEVVADLKSRVKKAKVKNKDGKFVRPKTKKTPAKSPEEKVVKSKVAKRRVKKANKVEVKTPKRVKAVKVKAKPKAKAEVKSKKNGKPGKRMGDATYKVIEAISKSKGPVAIVSIAHDMFGQSCDSEKKDSVRTIRNAIRTPIKFGILERCGRGKIKVTTAYRKAKGNVEKLIDRYESNQKE